MRIFHCKRLIIKSLSFIIGRNFVSWKVKPQKELATTSQEFEYLHRKSPTEMLKFQRRSCKLSFLFPPRRQCSPESWLAGYPAGTISHFSKSADDYWYSLFTPSKWPHFKGPVTYLLKPLLGKNFGGVAWTPFVMHWSFYSTVLPGDMQI